MANLRTDNLTGTGGRNAYNGSVFFNRGTASAQGDSLEFSGIAIGTSDFTIEGWLYKTKTGNYPVIFDTRESGNSDSGGFFFGTNSDGYLYFYTQSTNAIKQTIISNFSWYHFALVRTGGTTTLYLNGQVSGTYSDSNNYSNDITKLGTSQQYTGGVQNNWNWGGYLSNIRIVVGSAVYTSTFTPPTEKLKPIDGTVLLCCQDSDDPTQEATGKTITGFGSLQESDDTELVTNSGFVADISGWTTSGVQWTHSSGALMHFGNGNTQRNAYQNVTTVVGKRYVARVLASSAEASTAYWQIAGTTINYVADNNNSAQLEYRYYFTATSTSTQIRFYSYDSGNSSNVRSYWYLASIKLAPQGEEPNILPPVGVDEGVVFEGDTKVNSQGYMYFPTGDTTQRGRGRGLSIGGQNNPAVSKWIDYIQIQSGGIAQDFGEATAQCNQAGGCSSQTRGLIARGYTAPASSNVIEYVELAETSNALDFGELTSQRRRPAGLSNSTRGVWVAGSGEVPSGDSYADTIDYSTIASKGDAIDFGDNTGAQISHGGAISNSTRGVYSWSYSGGAAKSELEYLTIASTGSVATFGNLSRSHTYHFRGCSHSDSTRGVFAGGYNPVKNVIDYITIATTGNGVDWGDLPIVSGSHAYAAGLSDSHGGLSE